MDTNVVSEAMRPVPSSEVLGWLDQRSGRDLHLSAVSVAELDLGVQRLPTGRRRASLAAALQTILEIWFADRIVPFDWAAARAYGPAVVRARRSGYDIGIADAQIAATALARGFEVASRDERPFRAAGVGLINPWKPV